MMSVLKSDHLLRSSGDLAASSELHAAVMILLARPWLASSPDLEWLCRLQSLQESEIQAHSSLF